MLEFFRRIAPFTKDQRFTKRLFAPCAGKAVARLYQPGFALLAQKAGFHLPHLLGVHELVVHIHQVFMHEAVVAGDLAAKIAGFVCGVIGLGQMWGQRNTLGFFRVAGEDKDHTVLFAAGKSTDPVGELALA